MSAVFCCVHPRIDSPEPPSRPLTVSSSSLDGLLLAAAGLPANHPHVLRFANARSVPGTIDSSAILRSPGLKGRLRMKLSRRSLGQRRSGSADTEVDAPRAARIASICSRWGTLSSGKPWDADATALTSKEVIHQVDGVGRNRSKSFTYEEERRGRRRRRSCSEEAAAAHVDLAGIAHSDANLASADEPRTSTAQSVIRTTDSPIADSQLLRLLRGQSGRSSSAGESLEVLQRSQHRYG
jgi:hypothetical protein